jgi:hypothetical protein
VKDKLKIKNIFGGDSYKGEKVNSFEGKKLREVVDKNTFKLMSEGVFQLILLSFLLLGLEHLSQSQRRLF